MTHSNVEMPKSYRGVFDIVFSFSAACILFLVPVVSMSVNGQTASQTILSLFEKMGNTSYIFGLLFPFILMAIVGILKLAFRKVFPQFVLEVISLYLTVSACIGFIVATPMLAKLTTSSSFSLLGYSVGVSTGMCFPLLVLLSFFWMLYTLVRYCSFYRWYPLQTLFWGLHPIVYSVATFFFNLLMTLIVGLISVDSLMDLMLVIPVIVGFVVLLLEISIVMTYRKKWNSALRANWARKHPTEAAEMTGTSVPSEPLPATPSESVSVTLQPITRQEDLHETAPVPVVEDKQEPLSRLPQKRNIRPYVWAGTAVVVIAALGFFLQKGDKQQEPVNVPAIHEAVYEGKVGNAEVQMVLAQYGDTLTGSYFYKKHKQAIELKGRVDGANYVMQEFVDGKNTGTFTLFSGEYDGECFLEGTWANGGRQVRVYLDEQASRIMPSTDSAHPFVGEWKTAEGSEKMAFIQLGLYNKDINGEYAGGSIFANDGVYQLDVDSVLHQKGNDAILLVSFPEGTQQFKLHYSPSDKSLLIETEKWGTYHLLQDDRDLITRLEEQKKVVESIPQAPVAETEVLNIVEEQPVESVPSLDELLQAVETESDVNEDEEAEKARLKAELEAELQKEQQQEEAADVNTVYEVAEEMPEFPGGMSAMMNFIGKNLEYPSISQENGVQGRVIVQFVVDVDGSITDVKVTRSVDPYLDKEAVRVINAMPKWNPGKQKGQPVKVRYTVPINFKLG